MADKNEMIYGKRSHPGWMSQSIEAFIHNDGHFAINCTNKGKIEVYHYMIKGAELFDKLIEEIKKFISGADNIDDAINNLNLFLDSDYATMFLDDYPEYEGPQMRTKEEIYKYLDEAFDRVWLVRKQNLYCNLLTGQETIHLDIMDGMVKAVDEACKKWDIDFKEPVSDWDYGYWSGILAALRWVLGDEKDFLDT